MFFILSFLTSIECFIHDCNKNKEKSTFILKSNLPLNFKIIAYNLYAYSLKKKYIYIEYPIYLKKKLFIPNKTNKSIIIRIHEIRW